MDSDIKLQNGTVEIIGDQLQAAVSSIDVQFSNGHLSARGGQVELGTGESSTFRGLRQLPDGTTQIAGDKLTIAGESVEIGTDTTGNFKGLRLTKDGYLDVTAYALTVLNPGFKRMDNQQRVALFHSAEPVKVAEHDKLIINLHGHYGGGVRIDGSAEVEEELTALRIRAKESVVIPVNAKVLFLTPDRVIVNPVTGKKTPMPGTPIDLLETVKDLQNKVKDLQGKIAGLEEKIRLLH